jgi:nucleotide-binding universal stress UspA family protein
MKNILVAIDFHDKTQILIDSAIKFAKVFDSKIWLLHVAAPDPDFVGYGVGPQYIRDFRADELKEQHQHLISYADSIKSYGLEADGLVIQGAKIEMILEESEKLNIDMIITGHHDRGFFYEVFRGSVSSNIVSDSKIPVLVIPFGE